MECGDNRVCSSVWREEDGASHTDMSRGRAVSESALIDCGKEQFAFSLLCIVRVCCHSFSFALSPLSFSISVCLSTFFYFTLCKVDHEKDM